jgi:hypothetical protein
MVTNLLPAKSVNTDHVLQKAREIVAEHPVFRGRQVGFQFRIDGEQMVVRGKLPSFYLKQVLQTALKELNGIRYIDNQVNVVSSDGLSG